MVLYHSPTLVWAFRYSSRQIGIFPMHSHSVCSHLYTGLEIPVLRCGKQQVYFLVLSCLHFKTTPLSALVERSQYADI